MQKESLQHKLMSETIKIKIEWNILFDNEKRRNVEKKWDWLKTKDKIELKQYYSVKEWKLKEENKEKNGEKKKNRYKITITENILFLLSYPIS